MTKSVNFIGLREWAGKQGRWKKSTYPLADGEFRGGGGRGEKKARLGRSGRVSPARKGRYKTKDGKKWPELEK